MIKLIQSVAENDKLIKEVEEKSLVILKHLSISLIIREGSGNFSDWKKVVKVIERRRKYFFI
jgi:hypothetical protein